MNQPYNRLLKARSMAGFRSGRAAAAAINVKPATYASHENGTRSFSVPDAKRYADFFKVSAGWLLTGEALNSGDFLDDRFEFLSEQAVNSLNLSETRPVSADPQLVDFAKKILELANQITPAVELDQNSKLRTVAEVVIHRMFNDDLPHELEQWSIVSQWKLPKEYIADKLGINTPENAALIVMIDDNMLPTCKVDDKLIVNFSQKTFEKDGIYVFMDENSHLHIQRIKRANRTQLEISNDNPETNLKHPTRVVEQTKIRFIGYVCGNISVF